MELFYHFTDNFGGFSKPPFKSLNLALHVGDNPLDVEKNRKKLREKFDIKDLVFMNQVHKDGVKIVNDSNKLPTCDALITDQKNLALCVLTADCIPLLLYDKKEQVIAAIHAGRAGVFKQIAKKCIKKMSENFNSNPKNIVAFVGPHIQKCCYEISGEVLEYSKKNYPDFVFKNHLDISGILKNELENLGVFVKDEGVCACCDKRYFSYRRDGKTGRNAGIIMLRNLHV